MINVNDITINHTATIIDCLKQINKNGLGIVFLVKNKIIKGSVSDGDIRRSLIKGTKNSTKAIKIANKKFVSLKFNAKSHVIQKHLQKGIKVIPLLNDKNEFIDYASPQKIHQYSVMEPLLGGNELEYVTKCIETNWISSQGKYVNTFQDNLAKSFDTKYCLATCNGTVSLHLALVSLGIKEGDEVIVPNLTFGASVNSIIHAGAIPILADVDPETWNLTVNNIKPLLSKRTKAIMPVHLYGNPCDMNEIMMFAKKNNLLVIEDCAEAIGANVNGRPVGSFGNASAVSFFANKLITCGEGGAIVFKNKKIYDKANILRDHGMNPKKRYWHDMVGFNYRITNLQAAIGCAQLERMSFFKKSRKRLFRTYDSLLLKSGYFQNQVVKDSYESGNWLYSLCIKNKKISRNNVIKYLKNNGIDARPLFYPMNEMPAFKKYLNSKNKFLPVSKDISERGFSLPSSPSLKKSDIEYISNILLDYFKDV